MDNNNNNNKSQPDDDAFNMNWAWIDYLNKLMINYGMLKMEKDYEGMYDCLVIMENTLSPKIDKDESEQNLDSIKKNLRRMIVRGENGNIVKYYPQLIDETIDLLDNTYRLIMIKMDNAGLLTKKPRDPNKVFGNFKGS